MSKSESAKQHERRCRAVADETGYDYETVRHAVDHLWSRVRYYLANPLESRKGINLRGYFTFKINKKQLAYRFFKAKGDRALTRSSWDIAKKLLTHLGYDTSGASPHNVRDEYSHRKG